ncbi:MAG: hypothetical protein WBI41_11700, partial [Azovibrio sp.]|uniref:hypothetical protein n=1 Tax=Azovibrio sp. TaxID=1872673 RepID=UPI003C79058D
MKHIVWSDRPAARLLAGVLAGMLSNGLASPALAQNPVPPAGSRAPAPAGNRAPAPAPAPA